jgi:hypothetical protein
MTKRYDIRTMLRMIERLKQQVQKLKKRKV